MVTYHKTTSIEELKEILALQKRNLLQNLSKEEQEPQGFVTVEHSLEILIKMNKSCQHSIAKSNNKVIGYALSMTKEFANNIAVLKPMFKEIAKSTTNKNYIAMGQICIDKKYRGIGVFRGLYKFMQTDVCSSYTAIITEIDTKNLRSLRAHKSVGFKKIKDYKADNKNWRIVSLEV